MKKVSTLIILFTSLALTGCTNISSTYQAAQAMENISEEELAGKMDEIEVMLRNSGKYSTEDIAKITQDLDKQLDEKLDEFDKEFGETADGRTYGEIVNQYADEIEDAIKYGLDNNIALSEQEISEYSSEYLDSLEDNIHNNFTNNPEMTDKPIRLFKQLVNKIRELFK